MSNIENVSQDHDLNQLIEPPGLPVSNMAEDLGGVLSDRRGCATLECQHGKEKASQGDK